MKVFKKNQVAVFVIALMLITVGYLNFSEMKDSNGYVVTSTNDETIGDAMLVSSSNVILDDEQSNEDKLKKEEILDALSTEEEKIEIDEQKEKKGKNEEADEYYASSRLERDNMYSQMIESYQKMIDSEAITAEQKAIAQNEITKINNTKNAIMISENLIKTKGFKDVVILENNGSINVIVPNEILAQDEIAQIQNIVSREMKAELANIHIGSK